MDARAFRPVHDSAGLLDLETTRGLAWGEYSGSGVFDVGVRIARLGRPPSAAEYDEALLDEAVTAVFGAALGLLPRSDGVLSIGLSMATMIHSVSSRIIDGSYYARSSTGGGVGPLTLTAKYAPWSTRQTPFGLAFVLSADFSFGEAALRRDPGVPLWPRLVLEWSSLRLGVVLNLGYRWVSGRGALLTASGSGEPLEYDDQLTAGFGVQLPLLRWFEVLAGASATQIADAIGHDRALAAEARLGVRFTFERARLWLAGGLGLGHGYAAADGRILLGLEFTGPRVDRDGDGIYDYVDGCPEAREDYDGFHDWDGCPDLDNDRDGVPDARDMCPDDFGFVRSAGCPTRAIGDADGDGVNDYRDANPHVAGTPQTSPAEAPAEGPHEL